ncbi:MAG: methionine--tRNA ligase [Clostridiales bacterium]|nr:methionine--tRNA ligase [Clostridiales bacterium]
MKNILIGGAWPNTDGPLHIGRVSALLPGDVIARYHRAAGNRVFYVSGSDCHGTPVSIRAEREGKTPEEICERYHREFIEVFQKLGFSFDIYGMTHSNEHISFVREFHRKMYEKELIYEKSAPLAFCPECAKNLTDRMVVGRCPGCGALTRAEQCEKCDMILEPENLLDPACAQCGGKPVFKQTKQLFIALSKLESRLEQYLLSHPKWRKNAKAFTRRYLDEGLRDRAITRDLSWGISVPKAGFEDKSIYVWAENVLGYLSMSALLAKRLCIPFEEVWGENARHYYVHGKDNIPFHTIILPGLLLAHGENLRLPDEIISSEYMTLKGRKISASKNWAVWCKDLLERFDPDLIRYFLLVNGPERRDSDFSPSEFLERNNSELLGGYGNFVNRTLSFTQKYLCGAVPDALFSPEVKTVIEESYIKVGKKIESGFIKEALQDIFELVRYSNRYFDAKAPWKSRTTNIEDCENTIVTCIQLAANLSVLLSPFLPFSSKKLADCLNIRPDWKPQYLKYGYAIPQTGLLFKRIDSEQLDAAFSYLSE